MDLAKEGMLTAVLCPAASLAVVSAADAKSDASGAGVLNPAGVDVLNPRTSAPEAHWRRLEAHWRRMTVMCSLRFGDWRVDLRRFDVAKG